MGIADAPRMKPSESGREPEADGSARPETKSLIAVYNRLLALDVNSTEHSVLKVLAQHGDWRDGTNCFPSINRIARETRLSPRHTIRVLRALERKRILVARQNQALNDEGWRRGGRGKTVAYDIQLPPAKTVTSTNRETVTQSHSLESSGGALNSDRVSLFADRSKSGNSDICARETVTSEPLNSDIHVRAIRNTVFTGKTDRNTPPTPPAGGQGSAQTQNRKAWEHFKFELKAQLADLELRVGSKVRAGGDWEENVYDRYFRDACITGVNEHEVLLRAADPDLTAKGVVKYRTTLERIFRRCTGLSGRNFRVVE
jgi:hypothetical protein